MISTAMAAVQREGQARGSGPSSSQPTKVSAARTSTTGTKYAGDRVGQALHRRLRALGLLDQPDDLGERRVRADLGRAEDEAAGLVERRADDRVAGALLDRQALAGQHALVERRVALGDHAIDRHLLAGTTRTRSPTTTCSTGMSCSTPSRITRAVLACRPISALIAAPVCFLARASSQRPSRIRAMMMTADFEVEVERKAPARGQFAARA